jgi:hypothetical protein
MKLLRWFLGSQLALGVAFAQSPSTATMWIGGPGTLGTNGSADPGTLSDGSAATATIDFGYDPSTALLTVTVTNTSPVVSGTNTPVAGEIWFNLPMRIALTGATLVSQAGSGGAAPGYFLFVDPDPYDGAPVAPLPPFGSFAAVLVPPAGGGIARPGGIGTPSGATEGPVVFTIQVSGSTSQVSAEFSKRLYSSVEPGAPLGSHAQHGAIGFWNGGAGAGSGGISAQAGACSPIMFWSGNMKIGYPQTLFLQSTMGCHGCQVFSLTLGTSNLPLFLGFQLDIGGPTNDIAALIPFLFLQGPPNWYLLNYTIPNVPGLVGMSLYWHFVTNPVLGISASFEVSPMITTTILP